MTTCVFCQIVSGQLPSTVLYQNEHILAITPKESVVTGHTLLISKQHVTDFLCADVNLSREIGEQLNKVANFVKKTNSATGVNILIANGKDAQQSVMHLHFHLIPRHPNDGLDLWIKSGL